MQALAWIASLPLQVNLTKSIFLFQKIEQVANLFIIVVFQTEGNSTQTMGRVILECEHFVPALVKFVTMNVNTDGAVASSEPYLVRSISN